MSAAPQASDGDCIGSSGPKVALVSGASRGLGAALVSDFLARGYRVAAFSRGESDFITRLLSDPECGKRFTWAAVDARDGDALRAFVADTSRRHGRIDVLVNNAGIAVDGVLPLMRADDIDAVIDVNLKAALVLTQACTRVMLRRGGGAIVNVSSVNAIRGHAGVSVYSATKAALEGLTRSLARELGPRNIRVNAVAPGYFESEMVEGLGPEQRDRIVRRTPLGRLAEVQDIVQAIRFLTSDEAAFITGHTLVVDGGITS